MRWEQAGGSEQRRVLRTGTASVARVASHSGKASSQMKIQQGDFHDGKILAY
jgi:hypothetical protein